MDVSIVVGTYNRLEALKSCIACIRDSVEGLQYEIIVVDGGSTDGSLGWLADQKDTITIKQGRLVGACRAFTAGFRLARAPFVVHLNDDDEVQGDCIKRAYDYMQSHSQVGQVAFAFDLYSPGKYHFDFVFGKPYCNKGMTRRELGDRAGWWVDDYKTYAGDCELSCRIWEMGYEVVGLEECRVHDMMTNDELRAINNPGGVNEDSKVFYATRNGIDPPTHSNRRVLHVALNYGFDNQPALRRALQSMGPYRQIDWRQLGDKTEQTLINICNEWNPGLIFMQLQTPGVISPETAKRLRHPNRVVVNWSGDVRHPTPDWYIPLGKEIDWTLVTNTDWVDHFGKFGVNADYLQIGFNQEMFHPWGPALETPPIVFLGNHYGNMFPKSQERVEMVNFLRETYGDQFIVYGRGWPFPADHLNWAQEVGVYRGCKVAIGISQLDLNRYSSDRLHRAMGSGALYLPQHYPGISEEFENDKHLYTWDDLPFLRETIDFALAHPDSSQEVAFNGMELLHTKHTWLDRAAQLTKMIGWHSWR